MSGVTNAPVYKKWWFQVIIIAIIGVGGVGALYTKKESDNKKVLVNGIPAEDIINEAKDTVDEINNVIKDSGLSGASGDTTDDDNTSSKLDNSATREQKNALKKGESYAKNMHMSKAGVYKQLTSEYGEGFSEADAQYAVDQLDTMIDWNKNALEKAKSYYENMNMSKIKVYDQLISEYGERFTPEQAQYAIDHLDN